MRFSLFKMSAPAATASSSRLYAPSSFSSSFPYSLAQLRPYDPSSDARFYSSPRYVTHIDDAAISSLCAFYDRVLPRRPSRILDLCSSWVSHVPAEDRVIVGLGMNADELKANPALQHWVVHDLNAQPDLKDVLDTGGFDATICTVSIDYLTRPLEVMRSLAGVTIPGGRAYMAISNRCFPTKVSTSAILMADGCRLSARG